MLALSTLCAPAAWPLDRAIASFRALDVRAVALHRAAEAREAAALAAFARRLPIVAVFDDRPGASVGSPLLVVEGIPVGGDPEASLDELCRRLHLLKGRRVALRAPANPDRHPAPAELALIHEALPFVGYWHEPERAGDEYLDAAGSLLLGASFHPLGEVDLPGLRDALGADAPAVVACPAGTLREEVVEALRRARGVFRA